MDYSLTLAEASKITQTSVSTLRRWCLDGRVAALKDENGNWRISDEGLRSGNAPINPSSKAQRTVQKTPAVQTPSIEGALNDALERIVEPLRTAIERETARNRELMEQAAELRARIHDLEGKVDERDRRISELQEQRISELKQSAPTAALLDTISQHVQKSTTTLGTLTNFFKAK
jgi:DNA-binding transcriptional MerR regulator